MGILLSKKDLINWYMVLLQSLNVAPDSLKNSVSLSFFKLNDVLS